MDLDGVQIMRLLGDLKTKLAAFEVGVDDILTVPFAPEELHSGISERHLTLLEQSLLYLRAANAVRLVSREEILDTLWGVDYVAESNVVDRQIRNSQWSRMRRMRNDA